MNDDRYYNLQDLKIQTTYYKLCIKYKTFFPFDNMNQMYFALIYLIIAIIRCHLKFSLFFKRKDVESDFAVEFPPDFAVYQGDFDFTRAADNAFI